MAEEPAGDREIERFEKGSQMSVYLGLVSQVYLSGETVRHGKVTRNGETGMRGRCWFNERGR
jgi:transposase